MRLHLAIGINNTTTYSKLIDTIIDRFSLNKEQLFIPPGFAHGYLSVSKEVIFAYKVDKDYSPLHERTILWNDEDLAIDWEYPLEKILTSNKDNNGKKFRECDYL